MCRLRGWQVCVGPGEQAGWEVGRPGHGRLWTRPSWAAGSQWQILSRWVAGSDSDVRRSLEGWGGEEARGCAVMQEMKNPEDSGDPQGGRGTPWSRENAAPKAHPPGFRPRPLPQDVGQQTDPSHQPYLPKGDSRTLEGSRGVMPMRALSQGLAAQRLPLARGPCSSGNGAVDISTFYFCSSLSTARKTPHCMSTSPPRVPRSAMPNTSTR